jgi:hypothetical protein
VTVYVDISVQQAAPGERYLHEIVQHSLGVLQIVSLVPYTRRLIVDSTLSNDRSGMAVILDAASGVAFCDPEVISVYYYSLEHCKIICYRVFLNLYF